MSISTFSILFPLGILLIYFGIKLLVDNKNNKTPWYDEVFSYPLDILFLGIAYIGGIITKDLSISLLGIIWLIGYIFCCFFIKSMINITSKLFYSDKKGWSYFWCFFNYLSSVLLIFLLLNIYMQIKVR